MLNGINKCADWKDATQYSVHSVYAYMFMKLEIKLYRFPSHDDAQVVHGSEEWEGSMMVASQHLNCSIQETPNAFMRTYTIKLYQLQNALLTYIKQGQ